MVLWKKESTSDNACHINLLPSDQVDSVGFERMKMLYGMVQKKETMALRLRMKGNAFFQEKKWAEAMACYNQSICYAPNGSESLGLSYANRATCFLRLEEYHKCLADIELAKNAYYPQHLMAKLNGRIATCLKAMKELDADMDEKVTPPQLSYSPTTEFPGLADILEVRTNAVYGKHIVAKCDIDVGKIVLLEDAFVFGGGHNQEIVCKTCAKKRMNFIPCPNCFDVMFCNEKCMESNDIHKRVCGSLSNFKKNLNVEIILISVSLFPNADALIKFVECALASRDLNAPECESNAQMKYRLFLKLFALSKDISGVRQQIFEAYKMALEIPHIMQFFHSKREKRFLMHLIGQHHSIFNTNSFTVSGASDNCPYVTMVGICSSLFNHSCASNVLHLVYGNKLIGYIQRPVKKGEQLFINYFEGRDFTSSGQKYFNFQCKCSKCVPCWKEEDRKRIRSDADYLFFANLKTSDFKDHKKRLVFKPKLLNWFTTFGRLPWSPEFKMMESGYSKCNKEDLYTWDY